MTCGGAEQVGRRRCRSVATAAALEDSDLPLQELDIPNGLIEHGGRVHLGPARHKPLQDADLLADPLAAVAGSNALRVVADPHVPPPWLADGGGVDVDRLH